MIDYTSVLKTTHNCLLDYTYATFNVNRSASVICRDEARYEHRPLDQDVNWMSPMVCASFFFLSPIRIFCAIFLNLKPDFGPFFSRFLHAL